MAMGATLAASLAFGAAQALAAPRAWADDAARACRPGDCSRQCRAAGYDGGSCAGGLCECFIGPIG
jgi:hypothetical protein